MLCVMLGYAIDQDPGPALMVLPNADLCKSFAEQRLHPMIDDSEVLARHKPANPKKYRLQEIFFDRMQFALVGSNSPANLASRPVRYLFLDEVDKYPQASGREAGAIDLAEKRTRTFWNAKIVRTSTPTVRTGEIWRSYESGDKRKYAMPCPNCNEPVIFSLPGIKWPREHKRADGWDLMAVARDAWFECPSCQFQIRDKHKIRMLDEGWWESTSEIPRRKKSYHLAGMYPKWDQCRLGLIASMFLEARKFPDKFRDFINSTLGEPWEERGEVASETQVLRLRGDYDPGYCPTVPHVVIVTADVQKDCCYFVVRAWDNNETSWLLRHGKVATIDSLVSISKARYLSPMGTIVVGYGAVDSGTWTDDVYRFCEHSRWVPTKGWDRGRQPTTLRLAKLPNGLDLLHVQNESLKDRLQKKISIEPGNPGSWNLHRETDLEYARQICAEESVTVTDKWGRPSSTWRMRSGYVDNHYLDCEVLQLAMVEFLDVRYMRDPVATPKQKEKTDAPPPDIVTRRDGSPFNPAWVGDKLNKRFEK